MECKNQPSQKEKEHGLVMMQALARVYDDVSVRDCRRKQALRLYLFFRDLVYRKEVE